MESTFSFVVGLLTAALSLLGLVEKHPELPPESREQAQQVAEQAITQATQALATTNAKPDSYTPSSVGSGLVITYPSSGTTLAAGQEVTVKWNIPNSVVSSFPADFQVVLFLNVVRADAPAVNVYGIHDGNDPSAGSVVWKVPADVTPGTYRIEGHLSAQPKDFSRMCATAVGKDCLPNEADKAVMTRANQYKDESDWFTVSSAMQSSADTASACPTFTHSFSTGATDAETGGEVSRLQRFLIGEGAYPEAKVSGYFDAATTRALQQWQANHGIAITTPGVGSFGPKTRAAIQSRCARKIGIPYGGSYGLKAEVLYEAGIPTVVANVQWPFDVGPRGLDRPPAYIDFGDGLSVHADKVVDGLYFQARYTYPKAGTYTITLHTFENARRINLATTQITVHPQNSGQGSPPSQTTQLRAEKDIPIETYQFQPLGSPVTTFSEPYFGEGVVMSAYGTERVPQNVVEHAFYNGKQMGNIVRLHYANEEALKAFSEKYPVVPLERYEGGAIYIYCNSGVLHPAGYEKAIGKSFSRRCNAGAMGLITKQGEDVAIADWAYN